MSLNSAQFGHIYNSASDRATQGGLEYFRFVWKFSLYINKIAWVWEFKVYKIFGYNWKLWILIININY